MSEHTSLNHQHSMAVTSGQPCPCGCGLNREVTPQHPKFPTMCGDTECCWEGVTAPCCDGTGFTGNTYERCTDHYEVPGFGSAGMYV